MKWITGIPTKPGPYWLKLKYKQPGYPAIDIVIETVYQSLAANQLFFGLWEMENETFDVIQYCPIPEPTD